MKETTFSAFQSLIEVLDSDPRILNLKAIEEEMEHSDVLASLSLIAKQKAKEYEVELEKDADSDETKTAQKALYCAKRALDQHPLTRKYMEAYAPIRLLYAQIDEAIFHAFRNTPPCKEKPKC